MVMLSGCNAHAAQVLLGKGVEEGKILFLSLIAAPEGIHKICSTYPKVKVITSEIDDGINREYQVVPGASRLSIDGLCASPRAL